MVVVPCQPRYQRRSVTTVHAGLSCGILFTGGGTQPAATKTTTGYGSPETPAESVDARKEHAEFCALPPMARDEKTATVLDILGS